MAQVVETLQSMIVPEVLTALAFFSFLLYLLFILYPKQTHHRLPPSPPSLPIIGHLHHLGPLFHQSFNRLSTRYGPLIHLRLGSLPCVVASSPDLAHDFLKTNDITFANRNFTQAIDYITYGVGFAIAPYGPYWRLVKKMCQIQLLSARNLNHFQPIRTREFHDLFRTLTTKAKRNESVNMSEEFIKLTNNVVCQMVMSLRCSGTNSEADVAKNLVREATKIFFEFNVSDFFSLLKKVDLQGIKKRYVDIRSRYDVLLEKIISEREEVRKERRGNGDEKGRDFLDLILDVMEDEEAEIKLSRTHVKASILDLFTAGTDTTAITMDWTLVELINNPTVFEKAREEIDAVVGNKRLVDESDAPNLHYIHAIIRETFRLHPPHPLLIRKASEKVTVQGYDIPAGTVLFVNMWSIGRNPEVWESPLEFKPDRFLDGGVLNGFSEIKGTNYHLLPFGTGRRVCPAINLVLKQVIVVVANLIQCFDWNTIDNQVLDTDERGGLTTPRAVDLVCFPSLRKDSPATFSFA